MIIDLEDVIVVKLLFIEHPRQDTRKAKNVWKNKKNSKSLNKNGYFKLLLKINLKKVHIPKSLKRNLEKILLYMKN